MYMNSNHCFLSFPFLAVFSGGKGNIHLMEAWSGLEPSTKKVVISFASAPASAAPQALQGPCTQLHGHSSHSLSCSLTQMHTTCTSLSRPHRLPICFLREPLKISVNAQHLILNQNPTSGHPASAAHGPPPSAHTEPLHRAATSRLQLMHACPCPQNVFQMGNLPALTEGMCSCACAGLPVADMPAPADMAALKAYWASACCPYRHGR